MAGEGAPKPVPPPEAARKLRVLIREALDTSTGASSAIFPAYSTARTAVERLDTWQKMGDFTGELFLARKRLEDSFSTRRVSLIKSNWSRVNNLQSSRDQYASAARARMITVRDELASGEAAPSGQHRKVLNQMHDLIQSLPTVDHLPQTREGRVLRAIVAILRAHKIEGVADVTQEGVIGEDGPHPEGEDGLAAVLASAVGGTSIGDLEGITFDPGEVSTSSSSG